MTPKEQLIQELDDLAEPLMVEVLDFLQFLKAKQTNDSAPVQQARAELVAEAIAPPPAPTPSDRLPPIQAIYTDGACSGNPGPGGVGRRALFPRWLSTRVGGR